MTIGRTTQRTPENAKRICDAIKMGATYELACAYAGLSADTFQRWRKADAAFAAQIKEAEGAAAVGWLLKIEKAANDGEWQAAAWKLERRYPEQYGRRVQDNRNRTEDSPPIPWDRVPEDVQVAFLEGKLTLADVVKQLQPRD